MQRIYPVTQEACRPHCGKNVLLLMKDGSEIYGHLSRVEGGRIILNEPPWVATTKIYDRKRKNAKRTVKTKALKALPSGSKSLPGPGFSAGFALDAGLIATLLVI